MNTFWCYRLRANHGTKNNLVSALGHAFGGLLHCWHMCGHPQKTVIERTGPHRRMLLVPKSPSILFFFFFKPKKNSSLFCHVPSDSYCLVTSLFNRLLFIFIFFLISWHLKDFLEEDKHKVIHFFREKK